MTSELPPPSRNAAVLEFDRALHDALELHAKALPPTRSLELKRVASVAFTQLAEQAVRLKRAAVEDGDEDAAARLLMGECFAEGLCEKLRMWTAFREGDMDAAWAHLVQAQVAFEA